MAGFVTAFADRAVFPPAAAYAQPCWYAAYTRARHEKRVAEQLEKRDIECFLPLYGAVHLWKDRRMRVELPLFPGYVFVRIPLEARLRVLELPSVVRFVSFNGRPAPLPAFEIETLRTGLAMRWCAEPHPYLTVGQRVRIKSGPFEGLEGVLKRKKDNFRLVLSVDLIMRSILLDIDGAEVEAVH
jgi:transcription antitermination factor NusG